MSSAPGGRWVPTFAADIEPGDQIRRDGNEQRVIGRERPPAYSPTFLLTHDGGSEVVDKTAVVAIWDPDGSVAARVASKSAEAARGAGNAGGFVVPS